MEKSRIFGACIIAAVLLIISSFSLHGMGISAAAGTYALEIYADDGLVNTTQNITVTVSAPPSPSQGGGGSSSTRTAPAQAAAPPANAASPSPAPAPAAGQKEKPPVTESPSPLALLDRLQDTRIVRTRDIVSEFGVTKIRERFKNIDIISVEGLVITVNISKEVIENADSIIPITPFSVIAYDPMIEFPAVAVEPNKDIVIQYAFDKEFPSGFITDENMMTSFTYRQLTEEERVQALLERERLLAMTKEAVNVSVTYNVSEDGSADIIIDVSLFNRSLGARGLSVLGNIPKCLIEKLTEEFRKKNVESDIDLDVLETDPVTMLNLGDITEDRRFVIHIKEGADIDCEDEITAESFARGFILQHAEVNMKSVYLSLFSIIAVVALLIYLSSTSGHDDKKKLAVHHALTHSVSQLRRDNTEDEIKEMLGRRGYKPDDISYVLENYGKRHLILFRLMRAYIEFIVLFIILIMNIIEAFGLLPADFGFYKNIMSFVGVGYIIYKISMTKVMFGRAYRRIDMLLVIVYFLMLSKTTVATLKGAFTEIQYSSNLLIWLLRMPYIEEYSLFIGGILLVIICAYLTSRLDVGDISLATLLLPTGPCPRSMRRILLRFLVIFALLTMFYVSVYQLFMEWFTIVVDSIAMTAIAIVLLYLLIFKHHKKHALAETIESSEAVVSSAYERFFKFFRFHKTAFLGLAIICVLFAVTDSVVFLVPYTLGLEQSSIYTTGLGSAHNAVFSIFGNTSLFAEHIRALPLYGIITLAVLYFLNIAAMFLVLIIPFVIIMHIARNIDLPVRHVPKSALPGWMIASFISASIAALLTPSFRMKRYASEFVAGVDIQTMMIRAGFEPNMLGAIVAAIALAYLIVYAKRKYRHTLDDNRHHYLLFGIGCILSAGYIIAYIFMLADGSIPFVTAFIAHNPTVYYLAVAVLSVAAGMAVVRAMAAGYGLLFSYIAAGASLAFFFVYFAMYVADIIANHIGLIVSQLGAGAFAVRKLSVLLFTGSLYVIEAVVFAAAFFGLLYMLYTRNELGMHRFRIPLFEGMERAYNIHHATYAARKDMPLADSHEQLMAAKILKGLKEGYGADRIIGHLLSHDWDINMVHEVISNMELTAARRKDLLEALYLFYSEEMEEILRLPLSVQELTHDLAYFDCSLEFIFFEIDHADMLEFRRQELKDALLQLRTGQELLSEDSEKAAIREAEHEIISAHIRSIAPVRKLRAWFAKHIGSYPLQMLYGKALAQGWKEACIISAVRGLTLSRNEDKKFISKIY